MSTGFISRRCEPRTGYMKAANEPSTSIRDGEFRDWLKTYRSLNRNTAHHAAWHLPDSLHSTFLPNDQFNAHPAARISALITRRSHQRTEINVKFVRRNIPKSSSQTLKARITICPSNTLSVRKANMLKFNPLHPRGHYMQVSSAFVLRTLHFYDKMSPCAYRFSEYTRLFPETH